MGNCMKCGAVLPDGAASCPVCGSSVAAANSVQSQQPVQPELAQHGEPPKKKKKGLKIALIVLLCLFVLGGLSRCAGCGAKEKMEPWPQGELAQVIPSMDKQCANVYEMDGYLSFEVVEKVEKTDYDAYVVECEGKGFTEEAKKTNDDFEAYNADGYKLTLRFDDFSDPKIHVDVEAPEPMEDLIWPSSGPATLVPAPESKKGSIETDSEKKFAVYIGDTSSDAWEAYVAKCQDAGFNIDYTKGDSNYSAKNANGDSVKISYEGANTMRLIVDAANPSEASASAESSAESENAESQPVTETASTPDAPGLDPDFKAAMDEYESFMNGYVEFMNTYSESDNVVAMAVDYAKWTSDYADMTSKIDSIDENSLGSEEYAYYMEVMGRVNANLATIAA